MPTQLHTLSISEWLEVGSGSILVEKNDIQDVFLHFGSVAPDISSRAYHRLTASSSFSYGGSLKCFARANFGAPSVVVTGGI